VILHIAVLNVNGQGLPDWICGAVSNDVTLCKLANATSAGNRRSAHVNTSAWRRRCFVGIE
jgi:hypothetical protein